MATADALNAAYTTLAVMTLRERTPRAEFVGSSCGKSASHLPAVAVGRDRLARGRRRPPTTASRASGR
ncbi:hypothetical protein E4K10_01485 [Streptomyces sp. T1317-0309]|nr:hypothetical protein E4K10_01485 [Streptomyces sp. T1317-0309]